MFSLGTELCWRNLTTSSKRHWTRDGQFLVYNSRGHMYTYELVSGEIQEIESSMATDCNNDPVLFPDNTRMAIRYFTNEDATSRIYILPSAGASALRLALTQHAENKIKANTSAWFLIWIKMIFSCLGNITVSGWCDQNFSLPRKFPKKFRF